MKLRNILVVSENLEKSERFYTELFGLDVILRQEGNIILTEGLVLQERKLLEEELKKSCIAKNHMSLLYFEERHMDCFLEKLLSYQEPIEYVTEPVILSWGQTLVRFYDPDGNLIEVRSSLNQ